MRKSFSKYLFVKQYLREMHIPLKENILYLVLSFILYKSLKKVFIEELKK